MKTIILTQNRIAIVDDDDFNLVDLHSWYAVKCGSKYYAATKINKKTIYMHRLIFGISNSKEKIDHKNGDSLDNRKENLRLCNTIQNARNSNKLNVRNTSGYRGVSLSSHKNLNKRWVASINLSKEGAIKQKGLGYFLTAKEAAEAFDKAAKEIYGEFCGALNFPEDKNEH